MKKMRFDPVDFTKFNETDVREEILAPLLRELGYRTGTSNNVIREQFLRLRYNRAFLGRKNPYKDPELRGKADYICEVDGKIKWTVEAKSPTVPIGVDEVEQSYTYANHPEIRAVFFCICNGYEFRVYQTNHGPEVPPLLQVSYGDLNEKLEAIFNLLSPAAIQRWCPTQEMDMGKSIGLGLRSVARITGGNIRIFDTSVELPPFQGLTIMITGGAIERDENNLLRAFIKTLSPYARMQEVNERLGLARSEYLSQHTVLSSDGLAPTTFSASRQIYFSAGERMFDLLTWKDVILPLNIECNVTTEAKGVLTDHKFHGEFRAIMKYRVAVPQQVTKMVGDFEVYLA